MHDAQTDGEKVQWSEEEEVGATYNAFMNRKSLKRKRAAASTRKAKASGHTASLLASGSKPIVGKRPEDARWSKSKGKQKMPVTERAYGEHSGEDTELMDETLPDYIKNRKVLFEKTREKLGEAGLKLPPTYDDVEFSDDDRMEELREKPVLHGLRPVAKYEDIVMPYSAGIIPAPIAQWLRDYQFKGAEFLHELFVWQRGGILGDDMGLGKTIQVIAFLTAAFGKTGDERDAKRMRKVRKDDSIFYPRVMIICPGTLMENWKDELDRWGWWQVYTCHGSPAAKEAAVHAARQGVLEIMITTYTTYRMNQNSINTINWDCVIADECHAIKSRSSEITQAMNDVNALCRIGLTGTAIQNKYEELWTLLNWSNPGRFGALATWKTCISEPLKLGQAHDATIPELAKARKTANSLVHSLLPQFFLRRMKSLIADQLPKKSDRVVFCPLTSTQAEAYSNLIDSEVVEYIRTSSEPCPCESGKKRGWCCFAEIPERGKWQSHVFPSIATLQKLSNHLALLIPNSSDNADKQGRDLDSLQTAVPELWKDLYRERDSIMHYANVQFCGKWRVLRRLLEFWYSAGDKVLVFSHSVRLLKMLLLLFKTTTSYTISYLDGAMSYEDRARTVADFNSSPTQFVFIISTKAGGVGLNITSANKVVVVDPNWNPAYDLQAQDRAYRIGQLRDVDVFRLVSAGTIEEIVYARQIYKQQQANIGYNASSERRYFSGVQDRKEKKGEIFGLKNMFSFEEGGRVMLKDIVNKTNVAESRAGIEVVGLNIDIALEGDGLDTGDENAAMSQLAKLVETDAVDSDEKMKMDKRKTDAIQAILSGAGVRYTHENSEVVGTSRIEEKLSRNALENINDLDMVTRKAFGHNSSQPIGEEEDADPIEDGDSDDLDGPASAGRVKYRYRPPEDVRRRQFCSMALSFGFRDATEFALVVEGWTQEQRRNCLDKFYLMRKRKLTKGKFEPKFAT